MRNFFMDNFLKQQKKMLTALLAIQNHDMVTWNTHSYLMALYNIFETGTLSTVHIESAQCETLQRIDDG